jgi:hypothetical protein
MIGALAVDEYGFITISGWSSDATYLNAITATASERNALHARIHFQLAWENNDSRNL